MRTTGILSPVQTYRPFKRANRLEKNISGIRTECSLLTKSAQTLNILMVEDSDSDIELVKTMLKEGYPNNNFHITSAPRLVDAFNIIKRHNFDIVLLDLNLLDIQGVACVAALHSEIPETPIIVLSGMDSSKLSHECLLCGAQCYQVKGKQTPESLKLAIEDALA